MILSPIESVVRRKFSRGGRWKEKKKRKLRNSLLHKPEGRSLSPDIAKKRGGRRLKRRGMMRGGGMRKKESQKKDQFHGKSTVIF